MKAECGALAREAADGKGLRESLIQQHDRNVDVLKSALQAATVRAEAAERCRTELQAEASKNSEHLRYALASAPAWSAQQLSITVAGVVAAAGKPMAAFPAPPSLTQLPAYAALHGVNLPDPTATMPSPGRLI